MRQVIFSVCLVCGDRIGCFVSDNERQKRRCSTCNDMCPEMSTDDDSHGYCDLHLKPHLRKYKPCAFCGKQPPSKNVLVVSDDNVFCDEDCFALYVHGKELRR